MRRVFSLILVTWMCAVSLFSLSTLTITVGQTRRIRIPGLKRVAIGNSSIADVKVVGGETVLIIGKSPGVTNLTFWSRRGQEQVMVKVISYDPALVYHEVKTILSGVEGIEIKRVGDRVVIEGEVLKKEDNNRIKKVLELYPEILSFVHYSRVELKRMIKVDVKIMELSEKDSTTFGINWQDILNLQANFSWQRSWPGSPEMTLGIVTNFSSLLGFVSDTGLARILSNPVLLVRDGEEASFQVGGEFPVPVRGSQGEVNVEWKKYGTILHVQCWGDRLGDILLKLTVENSDVDFGNAVESGGFKIPGVMQRSTKTEVNLKEGQTLALAELILKRKNKGINRFFPLGYVPIIGEFFKSREMETVSNRFIVFITPTIIYPSSINNRDIKDIYRRYREMEKRFKWGIVE